MIDYKASTVCDVPWKSPSPNAYRLRAVIGYLRHDITKKKAPAWPFVRYIAQPKPQVRVSTPPFMKRLKKKKKKEARKVEKAKEKKRAMKEGRSVTKGATRGGDFGPPPPIQTSAAVRRRASLGSVEPASCDFDLSNAQYKFKYVLRRKTSSSGFILDPTDKCPKCYAASSTSAERSVPTINKSDVANRIVQQWAKSPCDLQRGHGFVSFPLRRKGKNRGREIRRKHEERLTAVENLMNEYETGGDTLQNDELTRRKMITLFKRKLDEI